MKKHTKLTAILAAALVASLPYDSSQEKRTVPKTVSYYDERAAPQRDIFLYDLEDYVNKQVDIKDLRKHYLDQYKGLTVLVIWSPTCGPCLEDFPAYNELFAEYQDRINFVGAVRENYIATIKEKEEEMEALRGIISEAGFENFSADFKTSLYRQVLKLRSQLQSRNINFYQERELWGEVLKTLEKRGQRLEFKNGVLDHLNTENYLRGGEKEREYPTPLVLLQDGEVIWRPKGNNDNNYSPEYVRRKNRKETEDLKLKLEELLKE